MFETVAVILIKFYLKFFLKHPYRSFLCCDAF